MAKKSTKMTVGALGLVITMLGIFAGTLGTWYTTKANVDNHIKADDQRDMTQAVKIDESKTAIGELKTGQAVINTKLENIDFKMDLMLELAGYGPPPKPKPTP